MGRKCLSIVIVFALAVVAVVYPQKARSQEYAKYLLKYARRQSQRTKGKQIARIQLEWRQKNVYKYEEV